MTTLRADILADRSFQSYQNPDIFKSWRSCSFQSYQKPGRHYATRQLSELRTQLFGSTKILSAVGIDIPVDRSFHSYQNPDNFKIWRSWSFQSYLTHGQHYAFRQLSELTTKLFGSIKILSTVGVDIPVDRSFNSYQKPKWVTQRLLKIPRLKPFRISVAKLRCPLLWILFWLRNLGAFNRSI